MKQAERRKFHYIYKITRFDGKYYIGMHSTDDLDDGYFGSGQLLWKSIKKHGKEKHLKQILEFLPSRRELKTRERELVNEEIMNDPLCMNLKLGGEGGWDHITSKQQRENSKRGNAKMRVLRQTNAEWAAKESASRSASLKSQYDSGRKVAGAALIVSEMQKRANTPEAIEKRKATFQARSHQKGEKNSQFGVKRIGINKDGKIKKVLPEQLQTYLEDGWKKGFR